MTPTEKFIERLHFDVASKGAEPIRCPCCGAQKAKPGMIDGYCDDCSWKMYKRSNTIGDIDTAAYLAERLHVLSKRVQQGKMVEKCHHAIMTTTGAPLQYQCSMYATSIVDGHPCCSGHASRKKGFYWVVDAGEREGPFVPMLISLSEKCDDFLRSVLVVAKILEQNETKT